MSQQGPWARPATPAIIPERVTDRPHISVVIPCLNEEGAVGDVVDEAWEGIHRSGRSGEVIVVDNASTDRSAEIAAEHGARVVREERARLRQRVSRRPRPRARASTSSWATPTTPTRSATSARSSTGSSTATTS